MFAPTGRATPKSCKWNTIRRRSPTTQLLRVFFGMHDPTTPNRQGPDFGKQYRSVIFFHDAEQEAAARKRIEQLDSAGKFKRKIVTQIVPAAEFYRAEDYHQRYFEKHGIACGTH